MKKVDVYEIAIKIAGLYLIVVLIEQLREVLFYASILAQSMNAPDSVVGFNPTTAFLVTLFCFLALAAFTLLLLFKTKAVAKVVCSKEDSEQTITLFTDNKSIYQIAFLVVGLLTVILALPNFTLHLKNYTKALESFSGHAMDINLLLTDGLKILIGGLSLFYARALSIFFGKDVHVSNDK